MSTFDSANIIPRCGRSSIGNRGLSSLPQSLHPSLTRSRQVDNKERPGQICITLILLRYSFKNEQKEINDIDKS